jgi:hypothetical protein
MQNHHLHDTTMRLLLLLSALLTALTGAVVSSSASAQPVEASVSVSAAKPGGIATVAPAPARAMQAAFATPRAWRAPAPMVVYRPGRFFGERRRQ